MNRAGGFSICLHGVGSGSSREAKGDPPRVRNYKDYSYYLVVLLLLCEFALWIVLTGILVLLFPGRRRGVNCIESHDHSRTESREKRRYRNNGSGDDRPHGLLHLKIAIAGRLCHETDVRDAAELRMCLGWVKSIWPNTLTSVEVSRRGKSIIFANGLKREATDNPFWTLKRSAERVDLASLGVIVEQPLIEMMVREWL